MKITKTQLLTYKHIKSLSLEDKKIYIDVLLGIDYPDDVIINRVNELDYLINLEE